MDTDTSAYYSSGYDFGATKFQNMDFIPWATADNDFSDFQLPAHELLATKGGAYKTIAANVMDWSASDIAFATPLQSYSVSSYVSGDDPASTDPSNVWGGDTDSEGSLFSPIQTNEAASPFSERKHSFASALSPPYIGPEGMDSPPPSKRACSGKPHVDDMQEKSRNRAKEKPNLAAYSRSKARLDVKSKLSGQKAKPAEGRSSAPTSPTPANANGHKIQLRTASRKAKTTRNSTKASPSAMTPSQDGIDDDALTTEERRARRNHNMVEKQYRNRLNAQFEQLLAVLPADPRQSADVEGSSLIDEDKRLSKAEVLDMARQRIKALEAERQLLKEEMRELLETAELMRDAVAMQHKHGRRSQIAV